MTRRKVLCDRHQADLLHAMQLLFEDRLGYELYVPVGFEFWTEGYWRFGECFGDDRLAQQYLNIDAAYTSVDLWDWPEKYLVTYDRHHPGRPIRAATLADVRATADEWAFVVATVQENQHGFKRLADELGAGYVYQVGNNRQQIDWGLDPLALVSSGVPIEGRGVQYLQEFDATGMFGFADPAGADRMAVASFVNCMPQIHQCWPTLEQYRELLPEHRFAVHGIDGPDGNLSPIAAIADVMRATGWAWHCKPQGDGFGHIIHDWAAVGRPLIGHASHYRGCVAEPFWRDLETCVDLDQRTPAENAALIAEISVDADRHAAMCVAIRALFDELVDFEATLPAVRSLLGTPI